MGHIMQQEIRFATFNVCNLAPPGVRFYANLEPYTPAEYDAKITWIARQLDLLDADVIGFQEIFAQAALKDVLARTQKYSDAYHAGVDPDPHAERFTPSVALVSRLPFAGAIASHIDLPRQLSVALPGITNTVRRFTRPVLHVPIRLSDRLTANVFVVHLKSKLPDEITEESSAERPQKDIAMLRSLIRRGAEALGLRYLVADRLQQERAPLLVLGDFNDVAGSVTTQIVLGGRESMEGSLDDRLFDSHRIQSCGDPLHDAGYTLIHDGKHETIDHILVSEAFHPASGNAIGEVIDVTYLNDHIALRQPEASDHGIVLTRIKLFEAPSHAGRSQAPAV
jgi:endonuclease/exonuclease/phosphatase family metal-dependent hydrolase